MMKKTGLTKLAEIAEALNLRGIKTSGGCQFTPTHIHRLLKNRLKPSTVTAPDAVINAYE